MTIPSTAEWQAYVNIYFPDKKKREAEAEVMHVWFRINFRAKAGIQGTPQLALRLVDDSSLPLELQGKHCE